MSVVMECVGGIGVDGVNHRQEVDVAAPRPVALLVTSVDHVVATILRRQRQTSAVTCLGGVEGRVVDGREGEERGKG